MLKLIKSKFYFDYDKITTETTNLFNVLSDSETYPIVNDFINSNNVDTLNIDFFLSHSGEKFLSRFVQLLIDKEDDYEEVVKKLAKIIYMKFATKWDKIYTALMTEYNPLENYSMVEERTPDLTFEETENSGSNIDTSRTTNATNKYKGFNASESLEVNKTDGSESSNVTGLKANNEVSKTTTNTGTESLTRSGNIGVTTSQQMLESEFKVRQYNFYEMIYKDIDSVLYLSTY